MKKAMTVLLTILISTQLYPCTGVLMESANGSFVNGRTVEFGIDLDMSVGHFPRNYQFVSKTPQGNGMKYTSKYAAVGIYCFGDQLLMDGVNEQGLAVGAFYFPGYAEYAEVTEENRSRALSPIDFPNWILSQFGTLEEVKKAVEKVVIAPTVFKSWGNTPPPFHYIVYDRKGRSIVIEPVKKELKIYDNLVGTITNSPGFDWHLQNLVNYIKLSPMSAKPVSVRGLKLTPFGQGSGLVGLPGDFTPPSRFVRATIFSLSFIQSKNDEDLIGDAFHVLNQFDIPYGSVRSEEGGKLFVDYTILTSVKDPKNLIYYYKSYDNQQIMSVDLKQFNPTDRQIKSMAVKGNLKPIDVSSSLK